MKRSPFLGCFSDWITGLAVSGLVFGLFTWNLAVAITGGVMLLAMVAYYWWTE